MKYLFFDIECANNFDGYCKMCSFGYVIINEKFELLKKEDIVINPEAKFDHFFFLKDSRIQLAYKPSFFEKQPNFNFYYEKIRNILTDNYSGIFGFDVNNDLKYVYDSCVRYNLKNIPIKAYDVRELLNDYDGFSGGLASALKQLTLGDNTHLKSHKSDDDALMTAKILQEICNNMEASIEQYIELSDTKPLRYNFKKRMIKEIKLKEKKMLLEEKLNEHYYLENNEPLFLTYSKIKYTLSNFLKKDSQFAIKIIEKMYDHGAILVNKLSEAELVIVKTNREIEKMKHFAEKYNFQLITTKTLFSN